MTPYYQDDAVTTAGLVAEFHEVFGCLRSVRPVREAEDVRRRMAERQPLLAEEYREYLAARQSGDLAAVASEMADLVYVVYGDAVALGIDLDAVVAEVHKANMTKVWPDGRVHYREFDGKVLKPPGFKPADVGAVLGL